MVVVVLLFDRSSNPLPGAPSRSRTHHGSQPFWAFRIKILGLSRHCLLLRALELGSYPNSVQNLAGRNTRDIFFSTNSYF